MHSPIITILLADAVSSRAEEKLRRSVPRSFAASVDILRVDLTSATEINAQLSRVASAFVTFVHSPLTFEARTFSLLDQALRNETEPDVLYSDSLDGRKGWTGTPVLRPDFSPERLRSQNYLGDMVFYRTQFLTELGGARAEAKSAILFDLVLRATAKATHIQHVSTALYRSAHSLGDASGTEPDLRWVLQNHLEATGGGRVISISPDGVFDTRREVIGNPLVSIVIPTRAVYQIIDGIASCLVLDAVTSIVENTLYENYEVVVIVDSVPEEQVLNRLREIAGQRLRIVEWKHPFNFSRKMNFGVLQAAGDFVLLLNDDVQVLTGEWLQSMLALAQLPNAGMVGAMLYYDDDTIQHAGHAYYRGSPTHIGLGVPRGASGPGNGYRVEREVSGVTAACALMPLSVFTDVGGFTGLLPGNFNDVDLCLKVGWKGYDVYWTPHAELYHFESKTRDAHVHYYELDVIEHRWGLRLDDSRFWRGHPGAAI